MLSTTFLMLVMYVLKKYDDNDSSLQLSRLSQQAIRYFLNKRVRKKSMKRKKVFTEESFAVRLNRKIFAFRWNKLFAFAKSDTRVPYCTKLTRQKTKDHQHDNILRENTFSILTETGKTGNLSSSIISSLKYFSSQPGYIKKYLTRPVHSKKKMFLASYKFTFCGI